MKNLNPVLVREIRQAVRNRVIIIALHLYLLAMCGVCLYYLLGLSGIPLHKVGPDLLAVLLYTVSYSTAAAVVLHSGGRLILERIHEDLMYSSTLTPLKITVGKVLSGFVISLLFYSTTLPFLAIAYQFQGVDIREILIKALYTFCLIQVFHLLVLAAFAGVNSIPSAVFRGVLLLPVAAGLWLFCTFIMEDMYEFSTSGEQVIVLTMVLSFLFVILPIFLFFVTKCQFDPPESNRMWSIRVSATAIFLPTFLLCTIIDLLPISVSLRVGLTFIWFILALYPFAIFCFLPMGERTQYGRRLRRNIPENFWGRIFVFPFYSGDVNGMIWMSLWIWISIFVVVFLARLNVDVEFKELSSGFASVLLCFNYAVASIVLWRQFFYRYVSKEWIGLITFGLIVLGAFVSITAPGFRVDTPIWEMELIFVPNFFWSMQGPSNNYHPQLAFALLGFIVCEIRLAVMAVRQFRSFVRYEPDRL